MPPLVIKTTGFADYLDRSGGAYVKCLILGQPDVGKTRSASFWPKPIFADTEKGLMSVADRQVPYVHIESSSDMDALLATLRAQGTGPNRRFETLVIDTFDSYQRIQMQERVRAERKERFSGWDDWGWLEARNASLFERLLSLKMNVVVNLHVKSASDDTEEGSMRYYQVKLKGDVRDQIIGEFDLVGMMENYYEAEKGKRVRKRHIRWHSDPTYPMLKDRSGKLPEFTPVTFSEEDYTNLRDLLLGGIEDQYASTEVVSEIVTGDPEPAPADMKGGTVSVPEDPTPKGAKKPAARKTARKSVEAVKAQGEEIPVRKEKEPATSIVAADVPNQPPPTQASHDEAVRNVEEGLGAQVVSDSKADEGGKRVEASSTRCCGARPDKFKDEPPLPVGCGREIAPEDRAVANLAAVKYHAWLCQSAVDALRSGEEQTDNAPCQR